jgi:hypothetical protein
VGGVRLKKIAASLFLFAILMATLACQQAKQPVTIDLKTPYSAVLLDNNQVYYGKLANAGSDYPELTDVYYIHSQMNPDTKAVSNILVPLGNELHSPDRMVLNAHHIILIEPVNPNSKVAQLIAEDKSKSH